MRNLITLFDLADGEIEQVFAITEELKNGLEKGERPPRLAGRVMALLFEKPSLRTRVSFETAMLHLRDCARSLRMRRLLRPCVGAPVS